MIIDSGLNKQQLKGNKLSGTTTPRAHNTAQVTGMVESGKVATICMSSVVLCRMNVCTVPV